MNCEHFNDIPSIYCRDGVCLSCWRERALKSESKLAIATDALERIRSFPIHSEPVGSAYAMTDIASEALAKLNPDKPSAD